MFSNHRNQWLSFVLATFFLVSCFAGCAPQKTQKEETVFDQWQAQDGSKRSKHRVTVESFTFVDSGQTPATAGTEAENVGGGADDDMPF